MTVDLELIKSEFVNRTDTYTSRIIVCAGTGCVANGALKIIEALKKELAQRNLLSKVEIKLENEQAVSISGSGCQGYCQMGPLLNIEPQGIMYVKVKVDDVPEIVEKTICEGNQIDRLLYAIPGTECKCIGKKEIPFYKNQQRISLGLCGVIDPEDISEYIYHNGYKSALTCLFEMSPENICKEVLESGLRGRGGGGFPTGRKWEAARIQPGNEKYIICNGDEGDPGAFMDRSVMEGNPHAVIEGMLIGAKAIGAHEGFVYVRAEYPLAVKRMHRAVKDATERGILGKNALGSNFSFTLHVMEGAGAFVCGEETALMASIMGRRGMPTPKPPFPAQQGLRDKPTIINNVETFATIPSIFLMTPSVFKSFGTKGSPGTKTFALTGHVANTGLIEVPFGTTLREIVFDIGGGITNSRGKIENDSFKAVQIGGPSGGCLTRDHLDMPLDFDSLKSIGAMVGSGGLVVMNKGTCIVKIAHYFMQFTQNESCGKCVPCREGTKQMLLLLEDIIQGNGTEQTLVDLEELGNAIRIASLCGLGKSAPNPVLSTIKAFRDEYLAHVKDKKCPSCQCTALLAPEIIESKCIGCGACVRVCPVNAIVGEKKKPHTINVDTCIKCGACAQKCKFEAVAGV